MPPWFPTDVEACIEPMRRYARVLTRDAAAADELVQDALLRAYERAASYRRGGPLKPWLLSILHNLHVNQRRRASVEARAIEQLELQTRAADEGLSADQAITLQEVNRRYQALPEPQRAVLHLTVVEGLSYREVADALAVPIGTVMSRLSRARAALRAPEAAALNDTSLRLIGGNDAS